MRRKRGFGQRFSNQLSTTKRPMTKYPVLIYCGSSLPTCVPCHNSKRVGSGFVKKKRSSDCLSQQIVGCLSAVILANRCNEYILSRGRLLATVEHYNDFFEVSLIKTKQHHRLSTNCRLIKRYKIPIQMILGAGPNFAAQNSENFWWSRGIPKMQRRWWWSIHHPSETWKYTASVNGNKPNEVPV